MCIGTIGWEQRHTEVKDYIPLASAEGCVLGLSVGKQRHTEVKDYIPLASAEGYALGQSVGNRDILKSKTTYL